MEPVMGKMGSLEDC